MKERFMVVLTPAGGNWPAPPIVRFRRMLKGCLRGYGLRAVDIARLPEPSDVAFDGPSCSVCRRDGKIVVAE